MPAAEVGAAAGGEGRHQRFRLASLKPSGGARGTVKSLHVPAMRCKDLQRSATTCTDPQRTWQGIRTPSDARDRRLPSAGALCQAMRDARSCGNVGADELVGGLGGEGEPTRIAHRIAPSSSKGRDSGHFRAALDRGNVRLAGGAGADSLPLNMHAWPQWAGAHARQGEGEPAPSGCVQRVTSIGRRRVVEPSDGGGNCDERLSESTSIRPPRGSGGPNSANPCESDRCKESPSTRRPFLHSQGRQSPRDEPLDSGCRNRGVEQCIRRVSRDRLGALRQRSVAPRDPTGGRP